MTLTQQHTSSLILRNYKISLYLWDIDKAKYNIELFLNNIELQHLIKKRINTYCIIEYEGFIYSIFYTGHINITKIQNRLQLNKSVYLICNLLNYNSKISIQIDNITYSGQSISRKVSLSNFCLYLNTEETETYWNIILPIHIKSIKVNFMCFPNCFIKTNSGTVILAKSGKYSMIGCRKESDGQLLLNWLNNSLINYNDRFRL